MSRRRIVFNILYFSILGLLLTECDRAPNDKSGKYCSYSKYENLDTSNLIRTEIIFKVIYEEWESDSILFVYHYTDTVINANEIKNEHSIFQTLERQDKKFKYGYNLNFSSSGLLGQYNLIEVISKKTGDYYIDSIYIFRYNPEVNEDDMNSVVFYSHNYGIIADYSLSWNNLLLLDSIYNKENVQLYELTDFFIKDSLLNHYIMNESK